MVRFILIFLLFLASLLAVFPAPTYHLWILAILVTEFSYIFIVVLLIVFLLKSRNIWYKKVGNLFALIALMLFLSPVFRAERIASKLPGQLAATFGNRASNLEVPHLKTPFSFFSMFSGIDGKAVPFQTFTYKTYPGISLSLDFYPVKTASKKPCVIVVHGGSWSGGDDKQLPELNSYLSRRGYQVASIDYRLAPEYQNPSPVEDVKSAISYLKANAEKLQIDTNNFVLLGRSAGAQIALLAAYTLKNEGIKGVISYYGPADMIWGYAVPSNPLVLNSRQVMEDYLGGTYQQVPVRYAASSPILQVDAQSVPTLLIHGKNDVLVSYQHSVRLNAKLNQLKVKHFFLSLPWATHGCDYNLNGPSGQLATYTVERFLNVVTFVK
ncbi:alpha/beta hydrolase [Mucilaginibacter arboris]|uniref:Alpha/beta hydrolase fold domain-containing protein n=1 Tax=Mucilaginibacter arboris TaxID=2682090 RepID=A0A7K1SZ43_9SPHI|nr:alpha/beta hydrolase [Mucilaginibacter arboris]MVN22581.1 alpha/beta hydrolase fold domain-containing protein [Mucilaginibacter arboris]